MWWKQHKWKVIVPVLIVAVLAAAFWYGGNAPGLQGWTVEKNDTTLSAQPDTQADAQPDADPVPEKPDREEPAEPDEGGEPAETVDAEQPEDLQEETVETAAEEPKQDEPVEEAPSEGIESRPGGTEGGPRKRWNWRRNWPAVLPADPPATRSTPSPRAWSLIRPPARTNT